jgi:hypothetical protein
MTTAMAIAFAFVIGAPRPAWAVADPSRAPSDVRAALHDGDYGFCKTPRKPLSYDAQELCAHASAIPDCEGFAAACSQAEPPSRSFDLPAWIEHAVGAVVMALAWLVKWVLLPGLAVVLLVWAIRGISRRRAAPTAPADLPEIEEGERAPPEPETPLDEEALLARADEQAKSHAFGVAVELYMAASLVSLDRRGALRLSRDRTNGEYVRTCSEPGAKQGLRALASEVDHVKFGGRPATAEGAARAAAAARGILRALPLALSTLSVLALLLCTGCGGLPGGARPGDDPAGQELLVDLLRRQGYQAELAGGSLSSLPFPEQGQRGPAVVVDLERTPLDEETRDHLLEWVRAGGSLVLAGEPELWPHDFGAALKFGSPTAGEKLVIARRLLARGGGSAPTDDEDGDEDEDDAPPLSGSVYASIGEHGVLARSAGVRVHPEIERVAWLGDDTTYAAVLSLGQGTITGVATGELLTNAALARPGNAAVAMAVLSNADRQEIRIAQREDGVSPPSSPVAAVRRAGLGLGLVHGLCAALILFAAYGTRLGPPLPEPPPARRAFVEHVEAVGALYKQGGHAAHALAAYTRLVDQRLRARTSRGAADVPAVLAARSNLPVDVCRRIWGRASAASADAPVGDELGILKELAAVYSLATDRER